MSAIKLRINATFYDLDLEGGTAVVGNIYSADGKAESQRDVLIPLGYAVEPHTFEVEAGNYVIEAIMPSGVILTDEVSLAAGETRLVELDAEDSPHETHSWQYLSGNLESGTVYHDATAIPTPRSYGSRVLGDEHIEVGEPAPSADALDIAPRTDRVSWIPDSHVDGWSFEKLNQLARRLPTADVHAIVELVSEGSTVPLKHPTESDGLSHLYRFDGSGPVGYGYSYSHGARKFALIEAGVDAFLVTLPVPWVGMNHHEVQVEIMVSSRQSPTGSPIAIAVRDMVLGPAIAYLGNGALTAAGKLFENVEGMLYGKLMNQFSAAAGAYVLLGTDLGAEPRHWHPWIQNLSDWFGWLPDGAIVWGMLQLRMATTDDQVAQALKTLKEGFHRGVPFYTLGLRWLIDGLSEFPNDPECKAMLQQARELSWRVDTRQPFVVLRMNGRRT